MDDLVTLSVTVPASVVRAYRKAGMVPNAAVSALVRAIEKAEAPRPPLQLTLWERERIEEAGRRLLGEE